LCVYLRRNNFVKPNAAGVGLEAAAVSCVWSSVHRLWSTVRVAAGDIGTGFAGHHRTGGTLRTSNPQDNNGVNFTRFFVQVSRGALRDDFVGPEKIGLVDHNLARFRTTSEFDLEYLRNRFSNRQPENNSINNNRCHVRLQNLIYFGLLMKKSGRSIFVHR